MANAYPVGPTVYCGPATIKRKGVYHDGSLALQAYTPEGEPAYTATVCTEEPPAEGCVWIKDWSENEGVLDALERAGIIQMTGRWLPCGFAVAFEGKLLVDFD